MQVMKGKKGYYFVVDTIIAIFIVSVGLLAFFSSPLSVPPKSRISGLSSDVIESLGSTKIAEYNDGYAGINGELWQQGEITNPQNTLLQQIGEFYTEGKYDIAEEFIETTVRKSLPGQFNLEVFAEEKRLYPINKPQKIGTLTKFRNLPDVVHMWGIWYDTGTVYAAVSTGNPLSGKIFKSKNQGASWDNGITVSNYRVLDIIGLNGILYATAVDANNPARQVTYTYPPGSESAGETLHHYLIRSTNDGKTWSDYGAPHPASRPRMIIFKNKIIGVMYNVVTQKYDRLFSIDQNGIQAFHPLNGWFIKGQYNVLADGTDGYLYALTDTNHLIRSRDLAIWEDITTFTQDPISLTYWPEFKKLVVGTKGINAVLYGLSVPAIPPATPEILVNNLDQWYQLESGYISTSNFGVYVTMALDNTLLIGLSSGEPADKDGAMIASFDGISLIKAGNLQEQGAHDMSVAAKNFLIAGTDPCCPDGGDSGNFYTYSLPDEPSKITVVSKTVVFGMVPSNFSMWGPYEVEVRMWE